MFCPIDIQKDALFQTERVGFPISKVAHQRWDRSLICALSSSQLKATHNGLLCEDLRTTPCVTTCSSSKHQHAKALWIPNNEQTQQHPCFVMPTSIVPEHTALLLFE